MPSEMVLDVASFRKLADYDGDLIQELIHLFLNECPVQFDRVRIAVEANDGQALRRAAHALWGTVVCFSAAPAANAAGTLEEIGRKGDLSHAAEACQSLSCELDRLRTALAEFGREK